MELVCFTKVRNGSVLLLSMYLIVSFVELFARIVRLKYSYISIKMIWTIHIFTVPLQKGVLKSFQHYFQQKIQETKSTNYSDIIEIKITKHPDDHFIYCNLILTYYFTILEYIPLRNTYVYIFVVHIHYPWLSDACQNGLLWHESRIKLAGVLFKQRGQRAARRSDGVRTYPPQTFHRTGGQMWYITSAVGGGTSPSWRYPLGYPQMCRKPHSYENARALYI